MHPATKTRERQVKLLRLALCAAAPDGEAVAAFLRFLASVLREGAAEFWLSPGSASCLKRKEPPHPPHCALRQMPFGKHRGRTLAWIAEHDPAWLEWAVGIARPPLKRAIIVTLDWWLTKHG